MLIAPLGSMACIGQRLAHSWQGLPHSERRFNGVNRRSRPPIAITAPSGQRNRQNARSTNKPAPRSTNAYTTNGQARSILSEMTVLNGSISAATAMVCIPCRAATASTASDTYFKRHNIR